MGRPATDKKDRLVAAAMRRFHHQGVVSSSLAAVAGDAGVPAGNVYYYFQSKDALAAAVIDRWCNRAAAHLERFDSPDKVQRVRDFLISAAERRQAYADFGCPLAALDRDLRPGAAATATGGGRPLGLIRDWLVVQLGCAAKADFCLSGLQGSFTLAHATGDPSVIARTVDQLLQWIDSLPDPAP